MGYATAKRVDAEIIPVVDITPLRNGTNPGEVAAQLHAASKGLGFIYIKGHGIPDATIDAARSAAFQFFQATDSSKEPVRVSSKHRGWLSQGGAKMNDDARPDLKESFIRGFQDNAGQTPADHPLRGPNQWSSSVPGIEKAAMNYFHYAHDVAHQLMHGFTIGLDLPQEFFTSNSSEPLSRVSLCLLSGTT